MSSEPYSVCDPCLPFIEPATGIMVRETQAMDLPAIEALSRRVYPQQRPWALPDLRRHLEHFPEGQLVAIDLQTGALCGMAASLVLRSDAFPEDASWLEVTGGGTLSTHDARHGTLLYGAEVMVDPDSRGRGVGKALYRGRRALAQGRRLDGIMAGARIPGYRKHASVLSAEAYVERVVRGEICDPTLSFQLRQGFVALRVVRNYLHDPDSLHHAVVIYWPSPERAARARSRGRARGGALPRGLALAPALIDQAS